MKNFKYIIFTLVIVTSSVNSIGQRTEREVVSSTPRKMIREILDDTKLVGTEVKEQTNKSGDVTISGKIKIRYNIFECYTWDEKVKFTHYDKRGNVKTPVYKTETKYSNKKWYKDEVIPKTVDIHFYLFKIKNVPVDQNGYFTASENFYIYREREYNKQLETLKCVKNDDIILVSDLANTVPELFKEGELIGNRIISDNRTFQSLGREYEIIPKRPEIYEYVNAKINSEMSSINIKIMDIDSRAPINATVRIKCLDPIDKSQSVNSISNNKGTLNLAQEFIRNADIEEEFNSNDITINGWLGTTYSISTINKDYNYFEGKIDVGSKNINKAILLVEKSSSKGASKIIDLK
jgi:hypothetical protein